MHKEAELIHQKNMLMLKILWGFFAIANIINLIVEGKLAPVYPLVGLILLALLTGVVLQKRWASFTMLLTVCFLFVFFYFLITGDPYLPNFIFMALAPLLSLFYHDFRAVLLSGILFILSSVYFFFAYSEVLFPGLQGREVSYLISYGVFITAFSVIHTKLTRNLWRRAGQSEERLRTILDSVSIGIWTLDLSTMKADVSDGFEQLTGFSAKSFRSNSNQFDELVYPEDEEQFHKFQQEMIIGRRSAVSEYRIICRNGTVKWVQNRGTPYFNHLNHMVRLEGVMIDITDRKQMEEKIEHLAYHDELTGLPNRTLFSKRFEEYASQGKFSLAVLFIDLNDFKEVNDTFGHDAGDLLLKDIANRLTGIVREQDMVCRLGGDEFLVLLVDIDETRVVKVADRIKASLSEGYLYQGYRLTAGASIGFSVAPSGTGDLEEMIRQADEAMYGAKKSRVRQYLSQQEGVASHEA
ncbi:sensor domain-containing diguanylate cyclase [Paenibacillus woosongensis]|uniref:Sensor domain-containing diguanylate cyclase n=1 Tax=Paenibacillus woosongensis TaxID=307580 RepID=A0AA95I317_9BACL|nr:sensor domain-containing diguanylate cyclase [Paenibacillus woosongensis]WHX48885.1 sensor domain-containing diguanylate cyclase [Paenibacillus woosongensis]